MADADLWLVRRLPAREVEENIPDDGYYPVEALVCNVRWQLRPNFHVTYWPLRGVKLDKVESFLRKHWSPLLSVLLPNTAITWRQKDGTVQLTCDLAQIPRNALSNDEIGPTYFALLNFLGLHLSIE
jgi:hypothetical protein